MTKVQKEEQPRSLAQRLMDAQKALPSVGLDSYNQHHKYKYTSSEAMIGACRAALHLNGLVLRRGGWTYDGTQEGGLVKSNFHLCCGETAECYLDEITWVAVPGPGRPIDKAIASALTASLGYYLRDLLLVPREDEAEMDKRDDTKYEPRKAPQAAPAPAPAPARRTTRADIKAEQEPPAAPKEAPAPAPAAPKDGKFVEVVGMRPPKDARWLEESWGVKKIAKGTPTKNGGTRWGILITHGDPEAPTEEWASCFDQEVMQECEVVMQNGIDMQPMVQSNQYGKTLYGIRCAEVHSAASEAQTTEEQSVEEDQIPF